MIQDTSHYMITHTVTHTPGDLFYIDRFSIILSLCALFLVQNDDLLQEKLKIMKKYKKGSCSFCWFLLNQGLFCPIWTMSNVDNDVRTRKDTEKVRRKRSNRTL